MKISLEIWKQIDPLLTLAVEMDDNARAAWLGGIEQTHPQLAPLLRKVLAAHDRAERSQKLETMPKRATAPPPSSMFTADARVGAFALVRLLGRGGMSEVWLASQADGRITRKVALKLPTFCQPSDVLRERFHRERDILAKLAHPHIARLFDAGVSEAEGSRGQPYLAMEYIEGESLSDFVMAHKLTITERLKLFRQILAAVAHAHRHLVVHRDLKPANILIDQSGQVKLLDFGIAKLLDDAEQAGAAGDLTRLGGRVMTLRYAAPEQVAEGAISTATDVYALGVILHELLTGLSPYRAVREGRTLTETALCNEDSAVPSSLALSAAAAAERKAPSAKLLSRKIAGDLDAIVLKAMRKNPADRYASVEQFDDDIGRHLDSLPVKAREGTWRYLAGRFAARYKLPIAATTTILLTVAAGLAMVERERRVAVVEKARAVAEKARAEKHFDSVRKLANAFMFEVHEEIVGLAGSLKAREMLVKTSLQYLDSLASESSHDPALTAELASAYGKIADIQGVYGGPNLGMLSDSLVNFEKGKKLFIALGDYKADDIGVQREHMMLRYRLARAYVQNSDARWQENVAAAVKLAERVASLKGAGPKDRSYVAGVLAEQAHLTSRLIGQSPEAEALVEKAVLMQEYLLREMPGELAVRDILARVYQRAADIFAGNRRTPQSLAHALGLHAKASALITALVREYPNEQRYPLLFVENHVRGAQYLSYAGRYAKAGQVIESALTQHRELVAADPENVGESAYILDTLGVATRIGYRQGDHAKAIRRGREGLAHFAATPEELRNMRDSRTSLSEVKSFLGLALMAVADRPGASPGRQAASLKEACALLADSVAFVEEVRGANPGAGDEDDAREYTDGLARCQAQLAKLSSR